MQGAGGRGRGRSDLRADRAGRSGSIDRFHRPIDRGAWLGDGAGLAAAAQGTRPPSPTPLLNRLNRLRRARAAKHPALLPSSTDSTGCAGHLDSATLDAFPQQEGQQPLHHDHWQHHCSVYADVLRARALSASGPACPLTSRATRALTVDPTRRHLNRQGAASAYAHARRPHRR